MKYKKGLVFICLLICLFSIASVAASDVNDTVVASDNQSTDLIEIKNENIIGTNEINEIGEVKENSVINDNENLLSLPNENEIVYGGTFKELSNTIKNSGAELNLSKNYIFSVGDSNYNQGIIIDKSITINGNGMVINGNHASRGLYLTSNNVVLKNITFINCACDNSNSSCGGAIYFDGDNGFLEDCNFINCFSIATSTSQEAYSYGGAIYWDGDNGTLKECKFINCFSEASSSYTASYVGGTKYPSSYGGAVYWNGYEGKLNNCIFINCLSSSSSLLKTYAYGGAISWGGSNGILNNSSFINCSSSSKTTGKSFYSCSYGGAISWGGSNGILNNSSFINCYAESSSDDANTWGGAVYWEGDFGTMNKSSFKSCYSSIHYSSDSYGGAVFWNGKNGLINNSYFEQCVVSNVSSTLERCGGAVYWNEMNGMIINSTFNNCSTSNSQMSFSQGGAIYWYGTKGILKDCIFNECSSVLLKSSSSSTINSYGGAVYWDGSNGIVDNNLFINCFSKSYSSYSCGGALYADSKLTLSNSKFVNCGSITQTPTSTVAYSYGGAVYFNYEDSTLKNCSFDKCFAESIYYGKYAYSHGGAVYWKGDNGKMEECNFTDCISTSNAYYVQSYGGAVYWSGTKGILKNCIFKSCQSKCDYINSFNTANSLGGAVYWYGTYGTMEFSNFKYCKAICYDTSASKYVHSNGGGIYWEGTYGSLQHSNFSSCSVVCQHYSHTPEGPSIYWNNYGKSFFNCSFNGKYLNYGNQVVTTNKFDPQFNINIDKIVIREYVTVTLDIINANSGEITLYQYNGTSSEINKRYDISINTNKVVLNFTDLTSGNYKLVLKYGGDEVFKSANIEKTFNIAKVKPIINASNISNLTADTSTYVNVNLNNDAKGNVTVIIFGEVFSGNVNNGVCNIFVPNLRGGESSFKIQYNGDDKYKPISINCNYNVSFKNSSINLNINDSYYFGDSIHINPFLNDYETGLIYLYVDSILETNFAVGDSYILKDLNTGVHEVKVIYGGDDFFSSCEYATNITIFKSNTTFNIETSNLTALDEISIELKFDKNATGQVQLIINNETYVSNVLGGKSKLSISNLKKGTYNFNIRYSGDNNCYPISMNDSFVIDFKSLNIDLSVKNIYYGETAKLSYSLSSNINETLRLYLNGYFLENISTINNQYSLYNLSAGKYNIKVIFNGNDYFDSFEKTTTFEVKKLSPKINVNATAGKNGTVIISFNNDATGNINFTVKNIKYSGELVNGSFNVTIPELTRYDTISKISYSGDSNYYSYSSYSSYSSTTFPVNGLKSSFTVNLTDINYGESLYISPIVTEGATGDIYVCVDYGTSYPFEVGSTYELKGISAGCRCIFIDYLGDSYYEGYYESFYVNVFKVNPSISIDSSNDNGYATINVNINSTATGTVNFSLYDELYSKTLNKGNCKFSTSKLYPGSYNLKINYSGDTNYNPFSINYTLNVSKWTPNIYQKNSVYAGNNSIISFTLYDGEATGNATLNISNFIITGEVIDGEISFIIPNIKPKYNYYTLNYTGDTKYNSYLKNSNVYVYFQKPTIDFNLTNILYGDNLTFSPKITPGASGNFDVLFDGSFIGNFSVGETFNHEILNGGIHQITLYYYGDEYFASAEVTKEFEVYRLNTTVNITDKLEANKSAIINVTLNEDAMFGVSITINNRKYSIDLVDGVATFNVPNLGAEVYDVIIEYEGDTKYAPFTITKQVNVTYKTSSIDLEVYNIYIGDSFVVNAVVNSDATGTLSIYLDDIFKKSISVGSKYTISNLNAGKYELRVKYNGDNYYAPTEKTFIFRVLTINPIDVNDMQIVYGTNNYFHAKFYDEYGEVLANKYVIFKVNGSDYSSRTDSNGVAYLNENLELGSYEIITINPFVNENRTNNLLVFSSVIAEDMVRAYNSGIDFKATFLDEHAKPLANTPILFKINGEDKVVSTDSNGVAILNVPLSVGTYTITSINTITDENKTNQLIVTPSIQSTNMIRAYNSSIDYKAIFLDNNAKPLSNTEIIFEVSSNQYRAVTDNNGQAILNIALNVGKYNITSINPATSEKSIRNLTIVERIVENQDMLIGVGSDSYYRVRIVDDDASFVGKDETVTFTINNHDYYIKTDSNGYAALKITENSGSHTITAKYKGFIVSNNIDIIQSIDSIMSIDVNDTDFNSKVIINVFTSPNYQTGNITITITGNNGYYNMFTQKASQIITKELTGLNVSSYNVNVKYVDFENYHVSEEAKTFNVLKINPNIIVTTDDAEYGQNASVTVNIPQVEGTVVIKIGDDITYTDYLIEDGVIIKRISTLPAGEYKVSVTFNGNDNYKKYTRYTTLNITKSFATFNVFAQDVEYGSNIKVLVSADLDGKATIKIDEETKTINLQANNEVEVIFSTLAIGKYKIYSAFSPIDSNNYYEEIDESNVEVTKIENIDVEIPNTVQNEDNVLSFNLPSDATGTITITINGNDYSTEVENGVVNIDLPDLINGNYDYIITYSGDEKYSSFTNDGSITVNNVISTVKARNMTINYGNEIDFQATFFESDGSPLVNKYIVFMIGSTEYPVKTDANGLAILQIGLNPGEYNITSINTKTDETKLNRLIVKSVEPKPIDEKDINVPALSGGFATIKLPNDASGTIILNIAGKNYDFAVVNGVTNIKVPELANGNYPYIIKYSGDSKYSSFTKTGSLTVKKQTTPAKPVTKTTLTLKKVTVKRSAKKLTIQATLKVNGKAVKSKIIKFKFNKKTYKAKTNTKGVAKIKITKKVLKKLKKGKKVTYTATYGKITKKVTVKVKK